MPTSKDEAFRAAQKRDRKPYDDFCAQIDRVIAERAGTPLPITINIGNTPRQVVDDAVQAYRRGGWNCLVVNDQRDGDYVQLT